MKESERISYYLPSFLGGLNSFLGTLMGCVSEELLIGLAMG